MNANSNKTPTKLAKVIALAEMSNREIVAEYRQKAKRQTAICDEMIADGAGHLTPSMMRADPNVHPLAHEDNMLRDRLQLLLVEAGLRHGPGLFSVESLVASQGGSYRRSKS